MLKRYNLELSFHLDPAQTTFDHTVIITPDHPKAKPVKVRLFGKIIPRCSLDTESIAFCGTKPGEQIVRRIEYRYRDPADREIRLVKAPDWLSGQGKRIKISLVFQAFSSDIDMSLEPTLLSTIRQL